MGKQERKEQGNEESMMWSRFVAVQWQITHVDFGGFMYTLNTSKIVII
jgi:hypothetical protein